MGLREETAEFGSVNIYWFWMRGTTPVNLISVTHTVRSLWVSFMNVVEVDTVIRSHKDGLTKPSEDFKRIWSQLKAFRSYNFPHKTGAGIEESLNHYLKRKAIWQSQKAVIPLTVYRRIQVPSEIISDLRPWYQLDTLTSLNSHCIHPTIFHIWIFKNVLQEFKKILQSPENFFLTCWPRLMGSICWTSRKNFDQKYFHWQSLAETGEWPEVRQK